MGTKIRPPTIPPDPHATTAEEFVEEAQIHAGLNAQFNQPRSRFNGQMLAPYNNSYRDLANAALKPTDANRFFALMLVYILIRGEEIYQENLLKYSGNVEVAEDTVDMILPVEVESDVEAFRFKVRKWSRRFNDEEVEEASALLLKLKKEAEKSRLSPTPKEDREEGEDEGKSRQQV